MNVDIVELEAQLAEFVRRAAAGEVIVVTDCGQSVAQLGPVSAHLTTEDATGSSWIRGPLRPGLGPAPLISPGIATSAELFAEDRGD
ncbi:MAG: hypothetical protein AAF467_06990 [Actinomycetota bacterium]